MIPLRDQEALRLRFARELAGRVRIDFFSQKPSPVFIPGRQECVRCEDVRKMLQELDHLSPRIQLTRHDLDAEPEVAAGFGVDKVPAIVIRGQTNRPVRFFGIPAGNQFRVFIDTLIEAAQGTIALPPDAEKTLRRLKTDISVQVLVTPGCAYSPVASRAALRLGLASARVKVDVIELEEFPGIAQRVGARAVPITVLEDRVAIPGAMDETLLAENLLLVAEKKQPAGPPNRALTPLQPAQPQQQREQPRTTPGGLIIPR